MEKPHYRLILAAGVEVGLAYTVLPTGVLDVFPHPTLPFRLFRLLVMILLLYVAITRIASIGHYYFLGKKWCGAVAERYPHLNRLPSCYRLMVRMLVNSIVTGIRWKEALLLVATFTLLIGGLYMHRLALAVALSIR